jgi:CDP-diacylglycerol--serine O-phosphatidyltransferase
MTKLPEEHRARGIYLLPNLFTLGALFAGFYAIVAAMKGSFDNAAIAIFVAMLMDSLDGRIARLTNTVTPFGAQLDSLSDMVSFGIAPALVIYSFSLNYLGKLGWLAAFVFTAAVALRLARFNTRLSMNEKRYFQGLPSPSGAGIIAGLVWMTVGFEMDGYFIRPLAFVLTVCVGLLMVSNVKYRSFKDLDMKGNVSFMMILLVVLGFVLISLDPPDVLFLIFLLYGISGPVMRFWHILHKRKLRKQRKLNMKEPPDETPQ